MAEEVIEAHTFSNEETIGTVGSSTFESYVVPDGVVFSALDWKTGRRGFESNSGNMLILSDEYDKSKTHNVYRFCLSYKLSDKNLLTHDS